MTELSTATGRRIGTGELFIGFGSVAMSGFGGVLPFARRMIVERRQWLTADGFTDILSLGQLLPGPNIVNVSVCIGWRFAGLPGVLACLAGLIGLPFFLFCGLGWAYVAYGDIPLAKAAFGGLAAAAAGLVIATGLKIVGPLLRRPLPMVVVAVTFGLIALLRWPLVPVVLGMAPVGILAVWWERRR